MNSPHSKGFSDLSYLWLFISLLVAYFGNALIKNTAHSFLCGDPYGAYVAGFSLKEDKDLDLRNQLSFNPTFASDQMAIGKNGEWYPVHDVMLTGIAALLSFISSSHGIFFMANSFMLAIAITLGFLSFQSEANRSFIWISSLLIGISPIFIQQSYSFSWDVLGALILVASWILLSKKKVFLSGLVWGLLFVSRINNVVAFPAYIFLALRKRDPDDESSTIRGGLTFCLAIIPGLIFLLGINYFLFGGPFEISHRHWAVELGNEMIKVDQLDRFTTPPLLGLFSIIFHPTQGLFVNAPLILFFSLFGLRKFFNMNRSEAIALILMYCSLFGLYSAYTGTVFVPARYFLAPFILSCAPVALGIMRILKYDVLHKKL